MVRKIVITATDPENFRDQEYNQPIEISYQKVYAEIAYYIHQNPVVNGFVYEAEHWIYNGIKVYEKNNGIVKLT